MIATKVAKVSTQVFCFMAEIAPKTVPKIVPTTIAWNPNCKEGPIRSINNEATG